MTLSCTHKEVYRQGEGQRDFRCVGTEFKCGEK